MEKKIKVLKIGGLILLLYTFCMYFILNSVESGHFDYLEFTFNGRNAGRVFNTYVFIGPTFVYGLYFLINISPLLEQIALNKSPKFKLLFTLMLAWSLVNLVFLFIGGDPISSSAMNDFWPISSDYMSDYDITEYLVYVIIPIFSFYLFNKLNSAGNK